MKRIESKIIRTPSISFDEPGNPSDAIAYTYGAQLASPWLKEYVSNPFRDSFKEKAFQKARREEGFDEEGNLLDKFSVSEVLDGKKFIAKVYPVRYHNYDKLLSEIEGYLQTVIGDNNNGVRRKGVRRINDEVYLSITDLLSNIEELEEETGTASYGTSLPMKDLDSGKSIDLDSSIEELEIDLDPQRYSEVNERTAQKYYDAQSLRLKGIKPILQEYEEKIMDEFGIPDKGVDERLDFIYDLDNWVVRYLFQPKSKLSFKDVFTELFGPKTTKKVASSTGDVNILEKKAFTEDYRYPRGNLVVSTETDSPEDSTERRGKVLITRAKKDSEEIKSYPVFTYKDEVYVSLNKVLENIDKAKERYSESTTKLDVEAFPKQ